MIVFQGIVAPFWWAASFCYVFCTHSFIHSFISGMHHYECVVPNIDIILQSGRFGATSIALFIVWGCPSGLLQFSMGEDVKICLASASSNIHALWPNRERRRAWTVAERCGCSVFRLTSSFRTWWYHLIPNSLRRHRWTQ